MNLPKIINLKNRNRDISKKIKHLVYKVTMLNYKHSDVKLSYPSFVMTEKVFNEYLNNIEQIDILKLEMSNNSKQIIYWRNIK